MNLSDLPVEFTKNATVCREIGMDRRGAAIWKKAARLAQRALAEHADELLPIRAAVEESGYAAVSLKRMHREGLLPNRSKREGVYLFRRGDLPRKPGHGVAGREPELSIESGTEGPLLTEKSGPDAAPVAMGAQAGIPSKRQIARAVVSGS